MLEVNLLGEETDLEHVKELHQKNNSEEDIAVLTDILTILFDEDRTSDEKKNDFSNFLDELPDDEGDLNLTEIEVEEAIRGIEQLKQILPQEFEYMKVIFEYVLDLGESLNEAEAAQKIIQDGDMDELFLTIPRENESPSGFGL